MHKKLEAELIHLAHKIIKLNKGTNISELQNKAREIYENLSVLYFIDKYFVETPEVTDDKTDFLAKIKDISTKTNATLKDKVVKDEVKPLTEDIIKPVIEKTEPVVEKIESVDEKTEKENTEQLIKQTLSTIKTEAKEIATKIQEKPQSKPVVEEKSALDEELKHSISADVAANMFEKADVKPKEIKTEPKVEAPVTIEKPKVNIATKQEIPTPQPETTTTSLNDRIFNKKIQVGLNDRIAFVKHLFNFSQEDFNRVLSQLNTFGSEKECKDFINNQVKADYDWSEKVEYEERLITLIERKFK
ncbi:MAG TPA: hypothetical protein EYG80_06960 [Flavobacteriaceae bacterium]|nr:hypothetical protein [Flavobacteriaceae bacterium]